MACLSVSVANVVRQPGLHDLGGDLCHGKRAIDAAEPLFQAGSERHRNLRAYRQGDLAEIVLATLGWRRSPPLRRQAEFFPPIS